MAGRIYETMHRSPYSRPKKQLVRNGTLLRYMSGIHTYAKPVRLRKATWLFVTRMSKGPIFYFRPDLHYFESSSSFRHLGQKYDAAPRERLFVIDAACIPLTTTIKYVNNPRRSPLYSHLSMECKGETLKPYCVPVPQLLGAFFIPIQVCHF